MPVFCSNGLPKDSGASDMGDSARISGIMAITGFPNTPDLSRYVIGDKGVRYPYPDPSGNPSINSPTSFTRDQLTCLVAGLYAQKQYNINKKLLYSHRERFYFCQNTEVWGHPELKKPFPGNFGDPISPSMILMMHKAANQRCPLIWYILTPLDLIIDFTIHIFDSRKENNQLIAKLYVLSPTLLKLYSFIDRNYRIKLEEYWMGWRNEPEMSKKLINLIK